MIRYVLGQGVVWPYGLVAIATVCVGCAHAALRRKGWVSAVAAAAVASSILFIIAATLARYGFPRTFSPSGGLHWTSDGWRRFTSTFGHSEEILLNVFLYVPAGLFGVLKVKRAVPVLGGLVLLSCSIEVLQGVFELGTPDVSDLASNSVGAYLGVVIASAILVVRRVRRRSIGLELTVMVALGALVGACVPVLAAHRQSEVVAQVRADFGGTR